MHWKVVNRKIHYWGALICAVPVIIVIVTGVLLLLKKEIAWIQPPTIKGQTNKPQASFESVLVAINEIPQFQNTSWHDVDRLDIRPEKGVIKVQLKNSWEIQMDTQDSRIMQVAYRRSDFIESIHDGSFFHENAKLGIFLPTAIILLTLWITGAYLFAITEMAKYRKKRKSN